MDTRHVRVCVPNTETGETWLIVSWWSIDGSFNKALWLKIKKKYKHDITIKKMYWSNVKINMHKYSNKIIKMYCNRNNYHYVENKGFQPYVFENDTIQNIENIIEVIIWILTILKQDKYYRARMKNIDYYIKLLCHSIILKPTYSEYKFLLWKPFQITFFHWLFSKL